MVFSVVEQQPLFFIQQWMAGVSLLSSFQHLHHIAECHLETDMKLKQWLRSLSHLSTSSNFDETVGGCDVSSDHVLCIALVFNYSGFQCCKLSKFNLPSTEHIYLRFSFVVVIFSWMEWAFQFNRKVRRRECCAVAVFQLFWLPNFMVGRRRSFEFEWKVFRWYDEVLRTLSVFC